MLNSFFVFIKQWALLLFQGWHALFTRKPKNRFRLLLILIILLPLILVWQLVNWVFFLLDEIFCRKYREVITSKTLFIVGVPRSGTTFLQRTLAEDPRLTTTTLAECLFAPSIIQRKIMAKLRMLFSFIGLILWPITKSVSFIARKFGREMDDIHVLGLQEAEEDFLLLLPRLQSFIQMVLIPQSNANWLLSDLDEMLTEKQMTSLMGFYQRMIQKHLYFHGTEKVYLSKNPSFTGVMRGLKQYFPDANIIACVRSPEFTVPSQFGSLKPAFDFLGHDINNPQFRGRIIAMLSFYYQHINDLAIEHQNIKVVSMDQLRQQLWPVIFMIYRISGWEMTRKLKDRFQALSEENRHFKSNHQYKKNDKGIATQFNWPLPDSVYLLAGIKSKNA